MRDRRSWLPVFLLVLAALLIRSIWIGRDDLSHDEPFTILHAHLPLRALFAMLPEENNPPLHFLFMHFWVKLVPLEEGWLRLPSAVFSALTIWPLFLLGRKLSGTRTAVIVSLLFIFSNYQQGFAIEARTYSLFALLAATSMWQLVRATSGRGWWWLVLVNVLLVYTHFFGWIMIGIQFLCILLNLEWRPALRQFMATQWLVPAAYLPYASIFLRRISTSVGEGTWLEPPVPEELYNMIWRWSNAPVVAVLLLAIIIIHLLLSRIRPLITRITVIWTFVPLLGMFMASFAAPMFLDRYLVHASLGFHLLAATALSTPFTGKYAGRFIPAITVAAVLFTFRPWQTEREQPAQVVEAIGDDDRPVFIHPAWWCHTYAWHLDRELFRNPAILFEELARRDIHPLHDISDLDPAQRGINVLVAGNGPARAMDELLLHRDIQAEVLPAAGSVHIYRL